MKFLILITVLNINSLWARSGDMPLNFELESQLEQSDHYFREPTSENAQEDVNPLDNQGAEQIEKSK